MNTASVYVHTFFSMGGGPASPAEWCKRASELGYTSLALADRAPLTALPDFVRAARTANLSPLPGAEFDIAGEADATGSAAASTLTATILAAGSDGLPNLFALASSVYSRWPSACAPLSVSEVEERAEGLVAILAGEGLADASPATIARLKACFPGRLFAGLPDPAGQGAGETCASIAGAASAHGLPLVAVPAARYLTEEDAASYAALREARRQAGWELAGAAAAGGLHLRPPGDLPVSYAPWPEAIENAARVAEMCALNESAGIWPPQDAAAQVQELSALARQALPPGPHDGLDSEIVLVEGSGQAPAWLALAQIAAQARSMHMPFQTGGESLLAAAPGTAPALPANDNSPLEQGDGQSAGLMPCIEVPGALRNGLLTHVESEHGRGGVALASWHLPVTPRSALQAALVVSEAEVEQVEELFEAARSAGWGALEEASRGESPQASVAQLALSLRGAPLRITADPGTLAVLPAARQGGPGYPLLSAEGCGVSYWLPWTCDALQGLGIPVLSVCAPISLSVLGGALTYAARWPVDGLDAGELDLANYPPHDRADLLLKKKEITGVPYLSPAALKGWKGDGSPESVARLIALSRGGRASHRPQAPEGIAAWDHGTADTGGALLYHDQFASIAQAAARMTTGEAARLRISMANHHAGQQEAEKARFESACLQSGMDSEAAARLYGALSSAALTIMPRQTALEQARTVLWSLHVKSAHPAAYVASWLEVSWERGGRAMAQPAIDEAHRLGVEIRPPDAGASEAGPTLEQADGGWAIRWGLALVPGWNRDTAARWAESLGGRDLSTVEGLAATASAAGLSAGQFRALVKSGACDAAGEREDLLEAAEAIVSGATPHLERAPDSPSPRTRWLMRTWEEQNLGTGFTPAAEMAGLQRSLGANQDLQAKLITTASIHSSLEGDSVCVVGLLHDIRLFDGSSAETGNDNGRRTNGASDTGTPPIAVAWVQDLEGEIELLAFPPNYKRHKALWSVGNAVIITARVCTRAGGDEPYLLCEQLASYETDAQEEALNIKVRVKAAAAEVKPTHGDESPAQAHTGRHPELAGADHSRPNGAAIAATPAPIAATATATAVSTNGAASSGAASQAPAYHLVITLPISEDDHADIDRMLALDKLLKAHTGHDTVTLRIPYSPETGAVTTAQLPRGVRYSPSLDDRIRELLGPDALALIKLAG